MNSLLYQRIYALVRQVPAGSVTSYGQLARQLGTSARVIGFALAALPQDSDVPWQRVINSQGRISPRADPDRCRLQRELLEAEGVGFDRTGRIDLERHGWRQVR